SNAIGLTHRRFWWNRTALPCGDEIGPSAVSKRTIDWKSSPYPREASFTSDVNLLGISRRDMLLHVLGRAAARPSEKRNPAAMPRPRLLRDASGDVVNLD